MVQEADAASRRRNGDDIDDGVQPYDFRRPDRIAKDQLRAIHLLHEGFARSMASSLSAYLRAYVTANLVSVEQIAFVEFTRCLPSPSCLAALAMSPFEGSAVLEINPSLVFPVLEMLLGGDGRGASRITREITEIEQSILGGLFRIILHDLRQAWHGVTEIEFAIQNHEREPQLLRILAPNEAVVVVSIEVRIGDNTGLMNLGIPSIVVKMLRQKFDQQWSVRKSKSTEEDQERVLRLIQPAQIHLDAKLQGPSMNASELMDLKPGDLLAFDFPVERPVDLLVNSRQKFLGSVVTTGRKKAFLVERLYQP